MAQTARRWSNGRGFGRNRWRHRRPSLQRCRFRGTRTCSTRPAPGRQLCESTRVRLLATSPNSTPLVTGGVGAISSRTAGLCKLASGWRRSASMHGRRLGRRWRPNLRAIRARSAPSHVGARTSRERPSLRSSGRSKVTDPPRPELGPRLSPGSDHNGAASETTLAFARPSCRPRRVWALSLEARAPRDPPESTPPRRAVIPAKLGPDGASSPLSSQARLGAMHRCHGGMRVVSRGRRL